jgi:murein DD-endopeptidase MepM/ murein hydrolase activator NlpD
MKSKILLILLILVLAISGYLGYTYYQADNIMAPIHQIYVNDKEIVPTTINYQVKYWGGYLKKDQCIFLINDIATNNSLNSIIVDGTILEITLNEDYYFDNKIITFKKSGEFVVDITVAYDDKSVCTYKLLFIVNLTPIIEISDLEPVQGELIKINIINLTLEDSLSVECEFSPSFIIRNEVDAMFYIPINYQKQTIDYPLKITINDIVYDYTFKVNSYEFSEIHFTVSESVTSATTGNPNAGPEYRELIWPLYDTYSEELYWDGILTKPVEEKRISSEFGQFRYINDSTYPTRHSGIDYAADCGTVVVAAGSGVVDIAYNLILSGNTVVIDHGLGFKSYYFHMQDLEVETGEIVEEGQMIGHVGMTGYATGCHLHFQTSIKNQVVNPELLYY